MNDELLYATFGIIFIRFCLWTKPTPFTELFYGAVGAGFIIASFVKAIA